MRNRIGHIKNVIFMVLAVICVVSSIDSANAEPYCELLSNITIQENGLAAVGDLIYGIADNKLFQLLPENNEAYEKAALPESGLFLASSGNMLAGFSSASGTVYLWSEQDGWKQEIQIDINELLSLQILDFALSDKTIFLICFDFNMNNPYLILFQRDNELSSQRLPASDLKEIASCSNDIDGVMYLRQTPEGYGEIGILTDTGDYFSLLQTPESNVCGLTVHSDEIWFSSETTVYRSSMDGTVTDKVQNLNSWFVSSSCSAVTDGVYYLLDQGHLISGDSCDDISSDKEIVISAITNPDIHQKSLQSCGLSCVVKDQIFFTSEQLAQLLYSQDPAVDIYFIDGTFLDSSPVFLKGFYWPLQSKTLLDSVERMHDPVRDFVIQEDKLAALPVFSRPSRYNLVIDLNVLEQAEKTGYNLPHSYEEYLVQVSSWPDVMAEEGILPHEMDSQYMVEQTIYQLLLNTESPSHIEQNTLVRLLALTRESIERIEACKRIAGPNPVYLISGRSPLYRAEYDENCRYLPVSLFGEGSAKTGIDLSIYFVNPYSQHKEEALRYLEAYQTCLTPDAEDELYADANHILERQYYEENHKASVEQIEMLEAQIAATKEGETKEDLQTSLAYSRDALKEIEKTRYTVDADSLRRWQDIMADGKIVSWGILRQKVIMEQINRFVNGDLSIEEFAGIILRMLKMQELEGW